MKKFIGALLALSVVAAVALPEQKAEAQVVYTLKCCDGGGNVRCVLENWTPVGNPCFCFQQGWGNAC
jgi:hypothetical protein